MSHNLQKTVSTVIRIAREAGDIAMQYYSRNSLDVMTKVDESPVTEADKSVNEFVIRQLAKEFPNSAVVAEEDEEGANARHVEDSMADVFYVDPIDGTKEFIKRNGEWSVMIGLTHRARPVMGVIYQPTADKLWYASEGNGAYCIEKGVSVKLNCNQTKRNIAVHSRSNAPVGMSKELLKFVTNDNKDASVISYGSFGLKMSMIASGAADLYVSSGRGSLWDSCAGESIATEAGAVVFTISRSRTPSPISYNPNRKLSLSTVVVCLSKANWPSFLQFLKSSKL
eukprot:TRINITY_DN1004_c8_g1_i1.p1 TRINITY_DN1004_c8_g1~~TRINITY_DN1004_c8_g1_i1.p1  ORF type:complete len:317 (+),score=55.03 TRINITY_DN1004_c8_g1_i1:103-951(+)